MTTARLPNARIQELGENGFAAIGTQFSDDEADVIFNSGVLTELAVRKRAVGIFLYECVNGRLDNPSQKTVPLGAMAVQFLYYKPEDIGKWSELERWWDSIVTVSGSDNGELNPKNYWLTHERRAALGVHAERVTPSNTAPEFRFSAPRDNEIKTFMNTYYEFTIDRALEEALSRELGAAIAQLPVPAEAQSEHASVAA